LYRAHLQDGTWGAGWRLGVGDHRPRHVGHTHAGQQAARRRGLGALQHAGPEDGHALKALLRGNFCQREVRQRQYACSGAMQQPCQYACPGAAHQPFGEQHGMEARSWAPQSSTA